MTTTGGCACHLLFPPGSRLCYYCRNPRTEEERKEFIASGIHAPDEETPWSREKAFEEERQRLRKKGRRKR